MIINNLGVVSVSLSINIGDTIYYRFINIKNIEVSDGTVIYIGKDTFGIYYVIHDKNDIASLMRDENFASKKEYDAWQEVYKLNNQIKEFQAQLEIKRKEAQKIK